MELTTGKNYILQYQSYCYVYKTPKPQQQQKEISGHCPISHHQLCYYLLILKKNKNSGVHNNNLY